MFYKFKDDVSVIVTILYYRCNKFYYVRKEDIDMFIEYYAKVLLLGVYYNSKTLKHDSKIKYIEF